MRAAEPYFAEDGITLHPTQPGAWLATGEVFRDLRTWSLGRATGRPITPEMLQASTGHHPGLRRLQSEMQMLFYTHPVSDERQALGLLPVNAFWITGAGVLPAAVAPRPELTVDGRLLPNTELGHLEVRGKEAEHRASAKVRAFIDFAASRLRSDPVINPR